MKAEHRKELERNLLADRMGRLVQGIRSGPQAASAFGWVVGVLVLVTIVGWYYARNTRSGQSEDWVRLMDSPRNEVLAYQDVARRHPGTIPGRTARFQLARTQLNHGLTALYSAGVRGQAVKDLRDAAKLFQELIGECQGNAVLEQEALLGAAKAEETLSGIDDPDKPDQKLGSLDKALALYRRLADSYPDTAAGRQAQKRVEEFQDEAKRKQIEKFYADLGNSLKKQGDLPRQDLGGLPPVPPAPAQESAP